jgi:diadenosine tetraphosphate (Ap4A) HIT family hydrolase
VKPKRHVTRVSDLLDDEATEVGPLLHRSAAVIDELLAPDQVYVCLWSHAGGVPGHVHYVVQPVTGELMNEYGPYGPRLQVAMFEAAEALPEDEVAAFADRARAAF